MLIWEMLKKKKSVSHNRRNVVHQPLHPLKKINGVWFSQDQDTAREVLRNLHDFTIAFSAFQLHWPSFHSPNLPGGRASFTSSGEPSLTSLTRPHPSTWLSLLDSAAMVDIFPGSHLSLAYVRIWSASNSMRAENMKFCSHCTLVLGTATRSIRYTESTPAFVEWMNWNKNFKNSGGWF